jgi:hypothetical protein
MGPAFVPFFPAPPIMTTPHVAKSRASNRARMRDAVHPWLLLPDHA